MKAHERYLASLITGAQSPLGMEGGRALGDGRGAIWGSSRAGLRGEVAGAGVKHAGNLRYGKWAAYGEFDGHRRKRVLVKIIGE